MSYSIKEAANLTGMTIRTLRYYDEIKLLPIERNTSNHRIYKPFDILKLSMIRSLKEIDIPLERIRDILKSSSQSIDETLVLQEKVIDLKIRNLNEQKNKVKAMISQRGQGKSIEEVLLAEYIDFEMIDIEKLYNHIHNEEIDFDYFFKKFHDNVGNEEETEDIMVEFIEYLNNEYHGYFTTDRLLELAETYKSEQAGLYLNKYEKNFHLYLSGLIIKYVYKRNN